MPPRGLRHHAKYGPYGVQIQDPETSDGVRDQSEMTQFIYTHTQRPDRDGVRDQIQDQIQRLRGQIQRSQRSYGHPTEPKSLLYRLKVVSGWVQIGSPRAQIPFIQAKVVSDGVPNRVQTPPNGSILGPKSLLYRLKVVPNRVSDPPIYL